MPHLLVGRYLVSRVAAVSIPDLLSFLVQLGILKIMEGLNRQLLVGSTADEITGIYSTSGVGSSADLTSGVSDLTVANIEGALADSIMFRDDTRRIFMGTAAAAQVRTLARPSAVSSLVNEMQQINGVELVETAAFGTAKPARGLVGPLSEIYLKTLG